MKHFKYTLIGLLLIALVLPGAAIAQVAEIAAEPDGGETVGNCLSYPVIWAEGVDKTLRGTAGMVPELGGTWWYWWGTEGSDPNIVPLSCLPDPDWVDPQDGSFPPCDDKKDGVSSTLPDFDDPNLVKAFIQKDVNNEWQAESFPGYPDAGAPSNPVLIDWFDWGDNLESVDWYANSMVRTEVVLFEDQAAGDAEVVEIDNVEVPIWPMTEYEMRHVDGWGIDEVHGLAANWADDTPKMVLGNEATVYSHCARLTIQKLMVPRESPLLELDAGNLEWVPTIGWTESEGYAGELVNDPIFNEPVWKGGDGPGYYSAEINVKGRVIFGYTWNVRDLNPDPNESPVGDYRVTFSLDEVCGPEGTTILNNTYIADGVTQILIPVEEEESVVAADVASEDGDTGAAQGFLVPGDNLSYIDVRILDGKGGGGGGGGNGGGNGNKPSAREPDSNGGKRGNGHDLAAAFDVTGACNCHCIGDKCTCDCLEECKCTCECIGEQCNCYCEENCGCDCAASDGSATCACMSDDCLEISSKNREMLRIHNELQARTASQTQQCPEQGCVCQDTDGANCQGFQEQFQHTFQELNQLRVHNACGDESCSCQCSDAVACTQVHQRLQETIRQEEQLQAHCQAGQCAEDEVFFADLRAIISGLAEVLGNIRGGLDTYLPALMQ